MYYWGLDVKHADGNLLVRHGMERIARHTAHGTSRYRMPWQGGLIELHGFCAGWYGPDGGIIFHRSRNIWLAWPHAQPPDPQCLSDEAVMACRSTIPVQKMLQRAAVLTGWVHEYERRAQPLWGAKGRLRHYRAFLKLIPRRWWLPPALSLRWFQQFAANPFETPRPKSLLPG